jgi:hypothetical protein
VDTPLAVDAPGVLDNDMGDGELTAVLDIGLDPGEGDLDFNEDGSFDYTPPAGWIGAVSFTYITCDGEICSAPAMVTIAVKTVPTAEPDTYIMGLATEIEISAPGVLQNDSGDGTLKAYLEDGLDPDVGDLTLNEDGSFEFTLTDDWDGMVTFTYIACDGEICSAPATVTIEEADSCLVVDPTSLEQILFQNDGAMDLTLINTCAVDVDFNLVESGAVTGTLLDEGFEAVPNLTLPPTGWEVIEQSEDTWYLTAESAFVDEGQYAAFVNTADVGHDKDEWLISSALDTSGLNNLVLSFRAYSRTNPAYSGATLRVWVRTVDGDKLVWDLFEDVSWDTYQYRAVHVDLSEFDAYDQIQIAWQYVSVDLEKPCETFGMDAVKVGGRSGISWLSQDPTSGTVAGGGERVITVTFESGLDFGRFEGTLFVRNVPYPVINVPVTLIVRSETDFLIYLPLITK